MDKLRSAAKRIGGLVLTTLAFLGLVEVPAQLAVLRQWLDGIEREHIAWAAIVLGLTWTVLGNLDWLLLRLPEGLRGRFHRGRGPTSFVHLERPYPNH